MSDAAVNEAPQAAAPEPAPAAASAAPAAGDDDGWEWSIVEIFVHRKHAGRTREEERFGSKLLRVDIPIDGDSAANGWETHYYGGASIFSYTPTTEETVMRINKPYAPAARYTLPAPERDDEFNNEGDDAP